jgi:hypothetical protein
LTNCPGQSWNFATEIGLQLQRARGRIDPVIDTLRYRIDTVTPSLPNTSTASALPRKRCRSHDLLWWQAEPPAIGCSCG